MKTFLDNRRDHAIYMLGIYSGSAFGWTYEPVMRWLFVPLMGEPPLPIVGIQTVLFLGFAVASAMIIESRDKEAARLDAMPHIEERDE